MTEEVIYEAVDGVVIVAINCGRRMRIVAALTDPDSVRLPGGRRATAPGAAGGRGPARSAVGAGVRRLSGWSGR